MGGDWSLVSSSAVQNDWVTCSILPRGSSNLQIDPLWWLQELNVTCWNICVNVVCQPPFIARLGGVLGQTNWKCLLFCSQVHHILLSTERQCLMACSSPWYKPSCAKLDCKVRANHPTDHVCDLAQVLQPWNESTYQMYWFCITLCKCAIELLWRWSRLQPKQNNIPAKLIKVGVILP